LDQGSFSNFSIIGPESAQTLQLFMYSMLLAVFSYGASWYAHIHRTRAARHLAVFVSVFSLFAWMWELWYVIPTLRGTSDQSNIYCNNVATRFCRTSQTASSFSVILEFALLLDVAWAVFVAATSVQPDITLANTDGSYNTEVMEADDLEMVKIAVAKGSVYDQTRQRMSSLGWFNYGTNILTMIGWIILTLASIQLSKDIGIAAYTNAIGNTQQWGDPIIATLWFPLTLTLGMSVAVAAYSSFRMNRSVTATAMLLAAVTATQWWSFFVYSARRFQQDTEGTGLSSLTDKAAQRAMVSGAGLIMCAETIKVAILVVRYVTFMPITREDQRALRAQSQHAHDAPTVIINDMDETTKPHTPETAIENPDRDVSTTSQPQYNQSMFAGTSLLFQVIFFAQLLVLVTFWCNEFVFSSNSGLFAGTPNTNPPYDPEQSFYFSQIQFIYQTVLILAVWLASFRAEREKSTAASTASFFVVTIAIAGWFLLIWPTAFQALPNQVGDINSAACVDGTGDWCRLTGAASVFSFILLFVLSVVWINSVIRLVASYTTSNGLNRTVQIVPTAIAVVMLSGIAIWALTTIRIGVTNDDFLAQQQQQLPGTNGASLEETYWASQVFLILTILSFASYVGIYSTLSFESWQSWTARLYSWMWSNVLVAILLPFFVLTTRFIQADSLNSVHLGVASGIIILFAGALFYHLSILAMCFEAYFAIQNQRKEVVVEMPAAAKTVAMPLSTTETTTNVVAVPDPAYNAVPVPEQQV
jgi:hypothetical protein